MQLGTSVLGQRWDWMQIMNGEGLDADHGYFDVGSEVRLGLGYKRMPSSMR